MMYGEQSVFEFPSNGEPSHHLDIEQFNMPVDMPDLPIDRYEDKESKDIEELSDKVQKEVKEKGKKKTIAKSNKEKSKNKNYEKRIKDVSVNAEFGRPSNREVEGIHLKENKSYNDIVYHFARFLIFLKLKQGSDKSKYELDLNLNQTQWISEVETVMNTDNFPSFSQPKPHFLLHPNSPHYVFHHYKKQHQKSSYTAEEVQLVMIAYLKRKGLLTPTIYNYINDYWRDIVSLVNNPRGDFGDDIPEDDPMPQGEVMDMHNENVQMDNRKRGSESEQPRALPENKLLERQLQADDSIAAYEIACYLHACCIKYEVKID